MRRALLACAVLTACGSPPPAAVRSGPAADVTPSTTSPTPLITSTTELATTTTTVAVEPTIVAVQPVPTTEAAGSLVGPEPVVDDPPSPQGRSTRGPNEAPDVWRALSDCESGSDPGTDTGNGYYGAFQFSASTWRSVGESGNPAEHSYAHQLAAAQRLQARSGWGQWPACSRALGLA